MIAMFTHQRGQSSRTDIHSGRSHKRFVGKVTARRLYTGGSNHAATPNRARKTHLCPWVSHDCPVTNSTCLAFCPSGKHTASSCSWVPHITQVHAHGTTHGIQVRAQFWTVLEDGRYLPLSWCRSGADSLTGKAPVRNSLPSPQTCVGQN